MKPHVYTVPDHITSAAKELGYETPCQERCGGTLTVRQDACPKCGWPATWQNSKWRVKQEKKRLADEKAKSKGCEHPACKWLIAEAELSNPVPGVKVGIKPNEAAQIVAFVEKNGVDAFKALVGEIQGGGRGLVVHVVNKLQFYRPEAQKEQEGPPIQWV